ncbi:MAG: lipid II flippase MurJ, partial [Candidatus Rokuibacteriota bacterium]
YVLLGAPLVALLFETGRFGAEDTAVVAAILAAYGVGLLAQAAAKLLASGYYGLQDTRTPVRMAIASLALGTALGWAFLTRTPFGVAGIAFGSALGAWAYAMAMLVGLDRRLGVPVLDTEERTVLWRVGVATTAAALAGIAALRFTDGASAAVRAVGAWGAFGVVYLGVARALGVAEARRVVATFRSRMG